MPHLMCLQGMVVIVVIVVIMVIMRETKIHLWPNHIVIRVLGYASSPVSTGHSGYVVILIILQKKSTE